MKTLLPRNGLSAALLVSLTLFGGWATARAAVFTVTNTNDSGAGSLRQAIVDANADAIIDEIAFNIPGAGPHVIAVLVPLPIIGQTVVIDGYTQPGSSVNTNGPWEGSNAVIQIVLTGNPFVSVGLDIYTPQCRIRGLAIGNFAGNAISVAGYRNVIEGCFIGLNAVGGKTQANAVGIMVAGPQTVIGGPSPEACNVISGNTGVGIWLSSADNIVENNLIGTNANGTLDRGNGEGIRINGSGQTIRNNLISANNRGITITLDSPATQILGNRIGTDVTGTGPRGNDLEGILIDPASPSGGAIVTIGSAELPNLIAYNGGAGIRVVASWTMILDNDIHSNFKGVVVANAPSSVAIMRTRIHDNVDLGVDLNDDGVTANDALDADSGPNLLQNFPIVTDVSSPSFGYMSFDVSLESDPFRGYEVQLFASPSCDASGQGEGAFYVAGLFGVTDGDGAFDFELNYPLAIPGGWYITATAMSYAYATSEFSPCVEYLNTKVGTDVRVQPFTDIFGDGPLKLTFHNVTSSGNTLLEVSPAGPSAPEGFTFGHFTTFYYLTTNASHDGPIQVCIPYEESNFDVPEDFLKAFRFDVPSQTWIELPSSIDENGNILCGETTTLSPIAIAAPNQITDVTGDIPSALALHPCAPNPFNPSTTIRYDVPRNGTQVTIAIFDVTGRRIRTLVDGAQPAGTRTTTWDGRDDLGRSVASGVYFYRMSADPFIQTRKMVLLK